MNDLAAFYRACVETDATLGEPDRTAKLRVVERYEAVAGATSPDSAELDALALLDSILRDLAAVYADRGTYRREWASLVS